MKLLSVLSLLILPIASVAQDKSAIEFKGVPIGATEAEFLKVHPRFECSGERCTAGPHSCNPRLPAAEMTACLKELTYGGRVPRLMFARFRDGKLSSVTVVQELKACDDLRDTLVEGYGQPSSSHPDKLRLANGTDTATLRTRWQRGETILELTSPAGDGSACQVYLTSRSALRDADRLRKEQLKSGARDL